MVLNTSGAIGYEEIKRMELDEFYSVITEIEIYHTQEDNQESRAINDPAVKVKR